jgi:hypothetical protein
MIAELHQQNNNNNNNHHQHLSVLSLSLVNEVFEYIHSDFKSIIYRQDNNNGNAGEGRLSISLIFNSVLEDYFSDVLLCYHQSH